MSVSAAIHGRNRYWGLSALLGVGVAALAVFLSLKSLIYLETLQLERIGARFKTNVLEAMTTADEVHGLLKGHHSTPCSARTLMLLRAQVYRHYMLRDIAVFKEDGRTIECTAQIGRLPDVYKISEKPLVNPRYPDRMLWNEPKLSFLPDGNQHHVSREGRFGLIMDTDIMRATFADQDWHMFVQNLDGSFRHHGFGNRGLYQDYLENQGVFVLPEKIVTKVCVPGTLMCMLIGLPFQQLLLQDAVFLTPSLLLSLLLGWIVFRKSVRQAEIRLSPQGRVRRALTAKGGWGFHCHYQPVVDLQSEKIIGCEVLARFTDSRGPVSQAVFIPVVEASGQTWSFTERIFNCVLDDLRGVETLPKDFRVAINIFPTDLSAANFDRLKHSEALKELMRLGVQVIFELLETSVTDKSDSAASLQYLKALGVQVAIDDFGTGFSNLNQLKEIDADYLKIDRGFIDELSVNRQSVVGAFVRHIVSLCGEMDVTIVAEGIENAGQLALLRHLNVQFGQGFFFSRPVPVTDFLTLLCRKEDQHDGDRPKAGKVVFAAR